MTTQPETQITTVLDAAVSMANMVWADVGATDATTLCSNVLRAIGVDPSMDASRLADDLDLAQRARALGRRQLGLPQT